MTVLAPTADGLRSQAAADVVCVEVGMVLFVVQDGLMKSLLGEFTVWMLILTRSIVTVLVLTPYGRAGPDGRGGVRARQSRRRPRAPRRHSRRSHDLGSTALKTRTIDVGRRDAAEAIGAAAMVR